MRYLPLTDVDRREMLAAIGADSVDDAVPRRADGGAARRGRSICRARMGELEVERALSRMAAKNVAAGAVPFFLGAGVYRHHVPAAVDHLIQRGEFLTSYTPYQPEIAQGTLQALFEFQTQVALITGMEVANASMYDGATACAEAVMMANRVTRRHKAILVRRSASALSRDDGDACALRRLRGRGARARSGGARGSGAADRRRHLLRRRAEPRTSSAMCAISRRSPRPAIAPGALLVVVVTEVVSLGLDQAAGRDGRRHRRRRGSVDRQSRSTFGGPYVGLFATREKFVRQMPGRLAGADRRCRRPARLRADACRRASSISAARRRRATSAPIPACARSPSPSIWRCWARPGFTRLAELNHAKAVQLAERLAAVPGVERRSTTASSTNSRCACRGRRAPVVEALAAARRARRRAGEPLLARTQGLADLLIVAATETNTDDDIDGFAPGACARCCDERVEPGARRLRPAKPPRRDTISGNRGLQIEEPLIFERISPAAAASICPSRRRSPTGSAACGAHGAIGLPGLSEPQVVRHYTRLSQKNYAIDTGLYPLGSCTMKHNPRLNEKMARLPGFADLHPLQPLSTVQGALELIDTLAHWLKTLTGMPAVAMSPAAGAHGELCGMMASAPRSRRAARSARACWCRNRRTAPIRRRRRRAASRVDAIPANDARPRRSRGAQGEARPRRRGDHADQPQHLRPVRGRDRRRSPRPCTRPAPISIATAPISTPSSAACGRPISASTACTSTCTRPSRRRMAAAVRARAGGAGGRASRPSRRCPGWCMTRDGFRLVEQARRRGSAGARPAQGLSRPDGHVRARARLHDEPRRGRAAAGRRATPCSTPTTCWPSSATI